MKALIHQASHFSWEGIQQTLDIERKQDPFLKGTVDEAVVVWLHIEVHDQENHTRSLRKLAKQIKWSANKRQFRRIVLHSFAHLGGNDASAEYAYQFLCELDQRLTKTGYEVSNTPFGWFCSWKLSTYGDSLSKVFVAF